MKRLWKILGILVATAILLNVVTEILNRKSLIGAIGFALHTPLVFLLNSLLFLTPFLLVFFTRRKVFLAVVLVVTGLTMAIANSVLLVFRTTPFTAADLRLVKYAATLLTTYLTWWQIVLMAVAAVAAILFCAVLWKKAPVDQQKVNLTESVCVSAVSMLVIWGVLNFSIATGAVALHFGNIGQAYKDYGFAYCFSNSLLNTGIEKPQSYDQAAVEELESEEQTQTEDAKNIEGRYPNIIMLQLESFFDPLLWKNNPVQGDPIPMFHFLERNFPSGYLSVPSVGAGTANTEFECISAMNLDFFGPGEYPYKTYAKTKYVESAASALSALGYGTEALHNNGGNFYSRAQVYNHMGFDHYTSKEFMNILQTTPNGWATDDVLLKYLDQSMNTTEGQDFVFTVSVQGHGEYPTENVIENPKIVVTGPEDEGKKNAWEYYVNMVHEMDEFAGNLVRQIEERGEPTVLVFYGDHLPTMGLEAKDLKSKYLYNTNYVIWDNIGLKQEDKNLAAYQIMAEVFDRLDIHSGTVFNYHQQRRQTKNYQADLELLQYDLLYGKQYAYDKYGSPIKEGHMVMGVSDVTLDSVIEQLDGSYSLYGENFTKQSKVYVNGEKQTSTFLNNTRLDLKDVELKDGDVIQVNQVGSSETIFRESAQYEYKDEKLTKLPDAEDKVETGRNAFVNQDKDVKKESKDE